MSHTFVLVHGGFHGGWCWREVAEILRSDGHTVTTPTLTGLGERSHLLEHVEGPSTFVEDVVRHLAFEGLGEVVLVGHSLAGLAITGAADRVPERLRQLVYLDSLLVDDGECASDTVPADVTAARRRLVAEEGGGFAWPAFSLTELGIPADHPRAAWVAERLVANPFNVYERAVELEHPIGNGLPSTYVHCTDPSYSSLQGSRDRAVALGFEMRELATGHDAMILAPRELAALLLDLAEQPPAGGVS